MLSGLFKANGVAAWLSLFVRNAIAAAMIMLVIPLGACAGPQTFASHKSIELVESDFLPPPTAKDQITPGRPYVIGPFDKLKIDVFGIEELSQRVVQIDANGRFSYPVIGTVNAAGMTPFDLEQELRHRLAAGFVRNPQVSVNLEQTVSQVVTVDGEVRAPGLYPVVGRMTLIRAIATANGTGEFAKLNNVVVFRTVGDQRYAALYNLAAIRQGAYPDPEIFANDVVVVSDSRARRVFRDFIQLLPLLTTPLIIAFQ